MPAWDKCDGCALKSGRGRCSFNRLVEAAIPHGLIIDYVETPSCIRLICEDVCFFCDPEEAHTILCSMVRRPVAENTPAAAAGGTPSQQSETGLFLQEALVAS